MKKCAYSNDGEEAFEDSASQSHQHGGGWFVPRGQPSRRGRGGAHSSNRVIGHSDRATGHQEYTDLEQVSEGHKKRLEKVKKRGDKSDLHGGKKEHDGKDDKRKALEGDVAKANRSSDTDLALKNPYDRRQNKLPPRLAKQREANRTTGRGFKDGWTSGAIVGGIDDSDYSGQGVDKLATMLSQLEDFNERRAVKNDKSESQENELPVQTIIFENTNFKGGRSADYNDYKAEGLSMPSGFNRPEDCADLKLDFPAFESDIMTNVEDRVDKTNKPQVAGHPSAEDLNLKIQSVKKVWECPTMPPVKENQLLPANAPGNQTPFQGVYENADKNVSESSNARSQPSVATQPNRASEFDRRSNNFQSRVLVTSPNNSSMPANSGLAHTMTTQSIMANQPPSLYQAFQIDSRGMNNQLYSAYPSIAAAAAAGQILQSTNPSTQGHDPNVFGTNNQYRLQAAAAAAQFTVGTPLQTQTSTGSMLLTQHSTLLNPGIKTQNQIGAIGTKVTSGSTMQQQSVASSPLLIQYNQSVAAAAAAAAVNQSAFYQALAANNGANTRTNSQYNLPVFNSGWYYYNY